MEHALQEVVVRWQALDGPAMGIGTPHGHRCPRLDGRVHVAEVPLVGGKLAVGVHEPLATEKYEL